MCAAVWSVPSRQVLAFPVQMLVRFWVNHHLLDVVRRPCWRVVKGRSKTYVDAILDRLETRGSEVKVGTKVVGVERLDGRLRVSYENNRGKSMDVFDEVVLATHSDVSLAILSKAKDAAFKEMTDLLSKIPYSYNDVYLHTDTSLMPTRRDAWASWNCVEARQGQRGDHPDLDAPVCVTYWANRLQDMPNATKDYFVTLNPVHDPDPSKVLRKMVLAHPIFGEESVKAQRRVASLQGRHGVYLCGAWCGYGFHEDGIKSAVSVLDAMKCPVPWSPSPVCSPKVGFVDSMAMKVFDAFARAAIKTGKLRLVLPNGEELVYGSPAPAVGSDAEGWRGRPPLNATFPRA